MSATATADAAPAPAKGGKKKLIIIIAAVLVLVLGGGAAAFMMLKKHPEAEEGAEGEAAKGGGGHGKAEAHASQAAPRSRTYDPKHPPVFVPLDPFTVNLADTSGERYAQIGITLEIDDPKIGEELKAVMPAVRNNVLMVLSSKTAAQLLTRDGKEKLARSILNASVRPLGFPAAEEDDEEEDPEAEDAPNKKKKKKKKPAQMIYPVTAVHFSTFIVQ